MPLFAPGRPGLAEGQPGVGVKTAQMSGFFRGVVLKKKRLRDPKTA